MGGVVVAVGASAAGVALTQASPSHPSRSATSPLSTAGPATKAAGAGEVTTTVPPVSTTLSPGHAGDSPVSSAPSSTVPPTTSTTAGLPQCQWSNFAVAISSAGASGSTVPVTVTVTNTGPTCADVGQKRCACWSAFARDAGSGQTVWILGAPNPPSSSVSVTSPQDPIPPGWTTSTSMVWNEDQCTYASCPANPSAQVHGTFDVYGEWAFHAPGVAPNGQDPEDAPTLVSQPPPVSVTIK